MKTSGSHITLLWHCITHLCFWLNANACMPTNTWCHLDSYDGKITIIKIFFDKIFLYWKFCFSIAKLKLYVHVYTTCSKKIIIWSTVISLVQCHFVNDFVFCKKLYEKKKQTFLSKKSFLLYLLKSLYY